jgi:[ribosomal protein S18]-alanine N-acetyltransferase
MENSPAEIQNLVAFDFQRQDADEIMRIQDESGLSFWSKSDYQNELNRNDSIFKLARGADEKIVGFALVRLLMNNSDAFFDSSEILNIAVRHSFQKRGIGQMIFDEILRTLKEKNIKEIWLEVRASNAQAVAFYQKNGFEMQFERKNYYQNPPENALVFRRLIDS